MAKYKQSIFVAALAVLCIGLIAGYYHNELDKAKQAEMDGLIAQGGHLVVMYKMLSKDDKSYPEMEVMRLLACEAWEKIMANKEYIISILPPDSIEPFQEMTNDLQEIAEKDTPAYEN